MAFRDIARDPTWQLPKHRDNLFYNTDSWVGPQSQQNTSVRANFLAANQLEDVQLVQFFLKKIADNPRKFSHPFIPPKEHPIMKVDGIFGEITRTWIEKFQVHLHNIGRPVLRDGVVDRIRNGSSITSLGRLFTLAMLNVGFGQITGDEGWDTWWKEPDVPTALRMRVRAPETFL